ncbi:cellulase family glycosylhydrolase [Pseudoduganella chitinolytica]|uniref:Cellulase family glycosylhydrolase n=1 Tax=Pseudoduganella chitinolytica TaxID=34070 RepID=A0ABY8BEY4_9BURK|nr:cellulase family glycosylhydrolase [Pseudoduganella chitinolytica]WEF34271.1 cellulase family glycosylhydrolase [Pseudoduganella chitinolytica]
MNGWLTAAALLLTVAGQASALPTCASAGSDPDGDGWGWENNQSCKVAPAATHCASAASDPDGDGWGWEGGMSCKVVFKGFRVAGSVVNDANGNPFVARGVNNPHAWYDQQSYDVLPNLAARKTNLIRVVWTMSGSATRLDQVLTAIEAQKMVSIVELHDGTGNNDAAVLRNMASYWVRPDVLAVLKKHERTTMVNIANEWGDGSKTPLQWRDDYKGPITTLRNAGLTTTLVIDNPDYGGNPNGGLWYGQELLDHDPRHNLLFAVHMYGTYNNPDDIYNTMNGYKTRNLPLLIGEFGYNYNNGANNLNARVDAPRLMQWAQQFQVGTVAWSTAGNDGPNAWLDLMTNWSATTAWGNLVWYSQYGIANTAKRATIY